jgi:Transglutaminase-like superfamily
MVVRFATIRQLPRRDKRLVLKTLLLLWRVQLSVWFNPVWTLETYHHLPIQRSHPRRAPVYQLLWAVQTAARFVPNVTSLTEALAAKALLAGYGYDSRLHVGVTKTGRVLEGHAWLSQGGDTLLGETKDLQEYRPISSVKGQRCKLLWRRNS